MLEFHLSVNDVSDVFVDSLKGNFLNFCAIPNTYKHNILLILLWTMNIFSLIFLSLDLESAKFFCKGPESKYQKQAQKKLHKEIHLINK